MNLSELRDTPSSFVTNLFDSHPPESNQQMLVRIREFINPKQTKRVARSLEYSNLQCKGSTQAVRLLITDHQRTAYYNNKTLTSVQEIKSKLKIDGEIPKSELGRITRMANFFTNGERFRYIPRSARQEKNGKVILFKVRDGNDFFNAKINLKTGHHSYTTSEPPPNYTPKKRKARKRVVSQPTESSIFQRNLSNLEDQL